jgi:predicted site-specific integrase-resolvase
MTPRALRPDAAAQYLGVTPFRIEEWMRDGLLEFIVPPGSDARVILVETLDSFIASLPRQKGTLAGRGRNVA